MDVVDVVNVMDEMAAAADLVYDKDTVPEDTADVEAPEYRLIEEVVPEDRESVLGGQVFALVGGWVAEMVGWGPDDSVDWTLKTIGSRVSEMVDWKTDPIEWAGHSVGWVAEMVDLAAE